MVSSRDYTQSKNGIGGVVSCTSCRQGIESKQNENPPLTKIRWKPPPNQWLMCNFASDWNKLEKSMGAAWVVRNHRGLVWCHSRRAFANIVSKDEAKLEAFLWAAESMTSHKFNSDNGRRNGRNVRSCYKTERMAIFWFPSTRDYH